jgi:hypothetical protein
MKKKKIKIRTSHCRINTIKNVVKYQSPPYSFHGPLSFYLRPVCSWNRLQILGVEPGSSSFILRCCAVADPGHGSQVLLFNAALSPGHGSRVLLLRYVGDPGHGSRVLLLQCRAIPGSSSDLFCCCAFCVFDPLHAIHVGILHIK